MADAGAFLKKAPLQVRLCSMFDLKSDLLIINTCQVIMEPSALSVYEAVKSQAGNGGPQKHGATDKQQNNI